MNLPSSLPIGTRYPSRYFEGYVASEYVANLTYRWGPTPTPYYIVPILGGMVCEWIPADSIFLVPV